MRRRWLEVALGAVVLVSGPLGLWAWNDGLGRGGFASPVGGEKWFAPHPGFFDARGFREPELSPTGSVFNWTSTSSSLHFTRLERSRPAVVTLRLQGPGTTSGRPAEVVLSVDGRESERMEIPATPRRISVNLPPRSGRGAVVSIKVEGTVGVMVENVRLAADQGSLPLPREAVGSVAFAALATYLAALLSGGSPWLALCAGLLESGLVSWLSVNGGAFLGRYSERLVWIAGALLLLSLIASRIKDPGWRRAWIAVLWITSLKLSTLGHPQILDADAAIHTANLRRVLGGDWLFTSDTPPPAISFPYPQGLSLAALPFTGLPQNQWATLLRVIVLVAEAGAAFAFSVAVAKLATPAVGALAFVFLCASPEGISVLFVGNLANQLADALMVLGCAFLIRERPVFAALSLLGGFLSHLGALLLGAPLALLLAASGGKTLPDSLRRTAPVLVALFASFVFYYRHFMGVVIKAWDRIQRLDGTEASAGPMTAPLGEKLQRMVGGEEAWVTLALMVTAGIGVATWPVGRKPLARLLLIWMAVIAGFTLLGLVTPIQVRSALSARPAIAVLCASGLCVLWTRGRWSRVLACALLALIAIGGWTLAIGFFPVRPS